MQLYRKTISGLLHFPINYLFHKWDNVVLQVKFMEFAIQCYENDLIPFEMSPRRQALIETIQGIKPTVIPSFSVWCSIDLMETLIEISASKMQMRIRTLFEFPLKNCPEYLLITLAQANPKVGSFLLDELYTYLLPQFLAPHVNSVPVLDRIWKVNPNLLVRGICELYRYF